MSSWNYSFLEDIICLSIENIMGQANNLHVQERTVHWNLLSDVANFLQVKGKLLFYVT